jgi:chemotaxis regulatin CheY-phosphate phosphatase CheZ
LDLKGPLLDESFDWILKHDDFCKWTNSKESGVFWIKGDPGKGKTMLLCGIINELENIPGIRLSYFFCQATDSRINNAKAIAGGLLRFFLRQRRQLLGHVYNKFKDKLDQLVGPNAWEVLREIFEMVTQDPSLPEPIFIVDALDECESDVKSLLNLIVETSDRIKWLVSSRNSKNIERKLNSIDPSRKLSLEIGENAIEVSRSVDAYINSTIQTIEALDDDEYLRAFTIDILKSKANGTYLWVSLVVGQLQDTAPRNVKDVLEEMPEGLESLYDLIMTQSFKRLGRKDREAYPIILSTIATAKRPLCFSELLIFIKSQWRYSDNIRNMHDIRDMVKDCGALLSIRDDTIYFVHQSAKDYLIQNTNALRLIFPLGIASQHLKMAEVSMHALSTTLTHNIYNLEDNTYLHHISPPSPDPLAPIAYCCVFWVDHLAQSCHFGITEPTIARVEVLFKDNGLIHSFLKDQFLYWLEALALLHKIIPQGLNAVFKLRALALDFAEPTQGSGTNCLKEFMNDADTFLHYHKYSINYWPLQLYSSSISIFPWKNRTRVV